jgi:hypothetical protein
LGNYKLKMKMKIKINSDDLLKHLMFWHEKTDDECVELATTDHTIDAEQALLNMIERDFCTEVNREIVEELKKLY